MPTNTTTIDVTNEWQEFADSASGISAVTLQNYSASDHLFISIGPSLPAASDRGLFIKPGEKELYTVDGKLYLRWQGLADGEIRQVGMMAS